MVSGSFPTFNLNVKNAFDLKSFLMQANSRAYNVKRIHIRSGAMSVKSFIVLCQKIYKYLVFLDAEVSLTANVVN